MQATIEKVSNLGRRLNVSLPTQEIEAEVENRLRRMARQIRMHGFRPGKVPLRLVQQQYGGQVRQEVLGDALQKSFGEAVRQQNLRVAGYPRFEAKPAEGEMQAHEYSATFEVYPEIVVGDVAALQIERPQVIVGDAEVDKTVEVLRKQRVRYETVERPAQEGDRVTIDYTGTRDGEAFDGGSGHDHAVVLGSGGLLAEFEKHLIGRCAGESHAFELTFPEDYHAKELAGQSVRFEVIVKHVEEAKLPDVDADLARALGIADGDLARMRADVKANLEREVRRRAATRTKDQVMKGLLESSQIELPSTLVGMEIERLQEGMRRDLAGRGLKPEQIPMPREAFEPEARKRVALGLIIAEVVRRESLQAKPDQLKTVVSDYAESYERPDEVVRWYYQSPERLREVESLVLENNVVEWALARAAVQDKATDFDDLMGNRA